MITPFKGQVFPCQTNHPFVTFYIEKLFSLSVNVSFWSNCYDNPVKPCNPWITHQSGSCALQLASHLLTKKLLNNDPNPIQILDACKRRFTISFSL